MGAVPTKASPTDELQNEGNAPKSIEFNGRPDKLNELN